MWLYTIQVASLDATLISLQLPRATSSNVVFSAMTYQPLDTSVTSSIAVKSIVPRTAFGKAWEGTSKRKLQPLSYVRMQVAGQFPPLQRTMRTEISNGLTHNRKSFGKIFPKELTWLLYRLSYAASLQSKQCPDFIRKSLWFYKEFCCWRQKDVRLVYLFPYSLCRKI